LGVVKEVFVEDDDVIKYFPAIEETGGGWCDE